MFAKRIDQLVGLAVVPHATLDLFGVELCEALGQQVVVELVELHAHMSVLARQAGLLLLIVVRWLGAPGGGRGRGWPRGSGRHFDW